MPQTLKESIDGIKAFEKKLLENKKDVLLMKELATAFEALSKLKEGPLAYLDITTTEEMIHLYDVDTEDEFEHLQTEEVGLTGATNPNNYAIIPLDIKLKIIKRTPNNIKIADAIVSEIIAALKTSGD